MGGVEAGGAAVEIASEAEVGAGVATFAGLDSVEEPPMEVVKGFE